MPIIFLGLGSNLGDRRKNIDDAVERLNLSGIKVLKVSSMIETDPVGGPPQGLFLNAAAKAETDLSPREVLNVIHRIEVLLGRVRTVKDGPRTIDIDILLYDNITLNEPDLVIPHPRMNERDFVLRPLKELF
ncbi:MAG: 2-amino-4-hydroxy-6-hydroxymethyldihydropteridine diphosphokinase [Candidatus Omnitrophica bacterium]|nr:2-amino-4-hydroxy-6-hydroxymethyldihydropteridine diphosphokinase [Candidatus Omnitrophota bacterium]